MPEFDSLGAAIALLSGRAGPTWAFRVAPIRNLMSAVVTSGISGIPIIPPKPYLGRTRPIPPRVERKRAAEELATECFDAFATRRFSRLEPVLEDSCVVLWGDGNLAVHPKKELLTTLEQSQGKANPCPFSKVRSYTYADLRATLARGLPESLDILLAIQEGLLVTFEVKLRDGQATRVGVVVHMRGNDLRVANLPLPAFDGPSLQSKRILQADEPEAWISEEIVRRIILGQTALLKADHQLLTEKLWLRDSFVPVQDLFAVAASGPHRIANADTVFLGTKEQPFSALSKIAGPKAAGAIQKEAPDLFGRPLYKLNPRIFSTELSLLDGQGGLIPKGHASGLLVRLEGEGRHRVAGLFI